MTEPADDASDGSADASRRRRLDRLGDLLPETTQDEASTAWGDDTDDDADRRLRREVPPHHE